MGWFDGLGRIVHSAVHRAEQVVHDAEDAATRTVKQAEDQIAPLVPTLKFVADQFQPLAQHGVGDVLFHPAAASSEPEVFEDQPAVTYRRVNLPLFAGGGPSPSDVYQGEIGDCYLMSSLASVAAAQPSSIINAIHDNGDGTYTVTLYQPKGLGFLRRLGWVGLQAEAVGFEDAGALMDRIPVEPVKIRVTGLVPAQQGWPLDAQPVSALWPCILEKAFAKLWGNYSAIGFGGSETVPLMALTGRPAQEVHFDDSTKPDAVWRLVESSLANGNPMTVGSQVVGNAKDDVVGLHGYSVVGAYEQDGQRYVVLRNPWGTNPNSANSAADSDPGDLTLTLDELIRDYDHLCVVK